MQSTLSSWMRGAAASAGVALAVAMAPGVATAGTINATGSLGSTGAAITGSNLLAPGTIHVTGAALNSPLGLVPNVYGNPNQWNGLAITALSLPDFGGVSIASGYGFSFSGTDSSGGNLNGDTVTFTATSGVIDSQSSSSLVLFLTGNTTFTGQTATLGSAYISMTSIGGSYSFSGTIASPPASNPSTVPEPASLALLGVGLLGLGMIRAKRA